MIKKRELLRTCLYGLLIILTVSYPLSAAPITLKKAVETLEKDSFTLKISKRRSDQAKVRIRKAWSAVFPKVDLDVEQVHNDLKGTRRLSTSVDLGAQTTDSLNLAPIDAKRVRLSLTQVLFDKKIPTQLKLGAVDYEIADYEYQHVKQEQLLALVQAYYAIANILKLKLLADHDVAVLEKNLVEIKNKNVLNLHTKEDVLKVEVDLSKSKQNLLEQQQQLRLAKYTLNHILGRDSREAIDIQEDALNPVFHLDISDSLGALETAWEKRPDFLKLLKEKERIELQIQLQKDTLWPIVSANSNYGYTNKNRFSLSEKNRDWSWTVGGSMRLFNGFDTLATMDEYELKLDEIRLQIELKKQDIKSEINEALYAMQLAQQRQRDAVINTQLADERVSVTKGKYEEKQATQLDIVLMENQYHEAKTQEAMARYELAGAVAQFKYAIGRNPAQL
jgi:outer membrane protein TolC